MTTTPSDKNTHKSTLEVISNLGKEKQSDSTNQVYFEVFVILATREIRPYDIFPTDTIASQEIRKSKVINNKP